MKTANALRAGALVLGLILAAGCAKQAPGTAANGPQNVQVNSWTHPHVLRYANAEDISSLNPLLSQQTTLGVMSSLTMAWLIKWDRENKPYPELATQVPSMQNGGVSKDGLTITYHLRKNVKWSDGAPFTADDVVWTWHAIMNPANNITSRAGWDRITRIDEPDKYTAVFHLSKPYAPFIVVFFSSAGANPCILPKHLLAQYPDINHIAYNSLPVGIGPFKYKEWTRSQRVVMVANPLYWRGLPKLKEIDFEIIPDRNTVMTEIQAHAIDMWLQMPGLYFSRSQNLSGFTWIRQPAYYYNHFDFNTQRPAVKDPVVRQALRYATDRPTIISKIGHNVGILQEQPAAKTSPYWDPAIKQVPFDIAKANQILDQGGWKMSPGGVRQKNGVSLNLEFATAAGSPDTDQMIELLRSWWKQIGVNLLVKHYPTNLLFAPYHDGGIVYNGKWDIIVFAWGNDPIGDYSFIYACDQIPPNGQNDIRWCNKRADKAMHDLYGHYDQTQRNADVAVLEEELNKDVPTIIEDGREDIFFFNKDLKNFHPNGVSFFDNMMDVDI
ncbi:MAG TPA: peptide ABC transporter substrate-binding protein [Candidatus Baltobacteraceae bacterium]|nr:peptide ABC transporter substrate-binding protein [Candidatus Baltobacteraceae bacterium]